MIGFIKNANIIERDNDTITLLAPTGLGYDLQDGHIFDGQTTVDYIWIWATYDNVGRPTYYAFQNAGSKQLAKLLVGCPGIGPKKAAAIIHYHGYDKCVDLLQVGSADIAGRCTGVSRAKGADIAAYLKSKLDKLTHTTRSEPVSLARGIALQILEALHPQVRVDLFRQVCKDSEGVEDAQTIANSYNKLLNEVENE